MLISGAIFIIFIIYINLFSLKIYSKRGLRGALIGSFVHTDLPLKTQSVSQQKNILIHTLNSHKLRALNAAYLQVRSQCDAFDNSLIDADIIGFQGLIPSPLSNSLKFGIKNIKRQGLICLLGLIHIKL